MKPKTSFKVGTTPRSNDTNTNMPKRPKITLGTAARSSIRKVNAFATRAGASSARKIAAPTPIGTAMSRAMAEVTTVP